MHDAFRWYMGLLSLCVVLSKPILQPSCNQSQNATIRGTIAVRTVASRSEEFHACDAAKPQQSSQACGRGFRDFIIRSSPKPQVKLKNT